MQGGEQVRTQVENYKGLVSVNVIRPMCLLAGSYGHLAFYSPTETERQRPHLLPDDYISKEWPSGLGKRPSKL